MSETDFFKEVKVQSLVKAEIVQKYLGAWATAILAKMDKTKYDHIAYMDLFSGPGRYEDGTETTPLLVLKRVVETERLRDNALLRFNDKEKGFADNLRQEINNFPRIDEFKYRPAVGNFEVGTKLINALKLTRVAPTLLFADPCGYKGLSIDLIASILPNWGCDCILFFNYNRINAALANPVFYDNMVELFGLKHFNLLQSELTHLSPSERESAVIEHFSEALQEIGGQYTLPFRFVMEDRGPKVSHHLVFVSKNVLGYKIMKEIMANSASSEVHGLGSFEYNPASANQPILLGYTLKKDELKHQLPIAFAGKQHTMQEIYYGHNVGTPFIESDYKEVLLELEAEGAIHTSPSAMERRPRNGKPTFSNKVVVTFPRK